MEMHEEKFNTRKHAMNKLMLFFIPSLF